MNNIKIFFLMSSFFFFFFSLNMFLFNFLFCLNWEIYSFNSVNFNFMIYLDWISMLFISVVMMIFGSVMMYSVEYMKYDKNIDRYIYLVLMFVYSMFFMILSPSILSILIGWDGLGLISYCLVIFYNNMMSYNSGMITILCNRLGDISLILMMCYMYIYGSWNLIFYKNLDLICLILLIICAFTKSAQFPFSIWLPAAMAAPTPVSSLVHSSTLVTSGVYLLIRYNYFINFFNIDVYMLIISSFTMFMAGLIANFEYDLKKIVALSTLSQLGLMMSILSLGFMDLALFHLLTHAMFKSLLFMCSGVYIHLMKNNQDVRFYGGLYKNLPFTSMSMLISIFSLCGFPFFAGFYSKDMIMEIMFMNNMNLLILLMLLISTIFTVSYNFRLILYLFYNNYMFNSYMNFMETKFMSISMILLIFMSLILGKIMIFLFFYSYLIILDLFMKLIVLIMCVVGLIIGYLFYLFNNNKGLFFYMIFSMFYMNMFYKMFIKLLNFGFYLNLYFDKFIENKFSLIFIKFSLFFLNYNYKINNFMNILKMIVMMIIFYFLIF
nr:NADH dehydrogenase subunit 5 [Cerceris albofasciata]